MTKPLTCGYGDGVLDDPCPDTLTFMRLKTTTAMIAVATALTACSASAPMPMPTASSIPPSPTTASVTTPAPDMSSPQTPGERLTAAGVECPDEISGQTDCTYHGENATVTVGDWAATRDQRRQACDAGYINAAYLVATDGTLTIAADHNATTRALAERLGLDLQPYCPS